MSYRKKYGFTLIELVLAVVILAILATMTIKVYSHIEERAKVKAAKVEMERIRRVILEEYLEDMGRIPRFCAENIRINSLLSRTNHLDVLEERFLKWDEEALRGWRGPYLRGNIGVFPGRGEVDGSFYPDVSKLDLPDDFRSGRASVYGYSGEVSILDPWGRPYVLQVPPPESFVLGATNRFRYSRIVSAGRDGVISSPCYFTTNDVTPVTAETRRKSSRLAGLERDGRTLRGDDLVLFLVREDFWEE